MATGAQQAGEAVVDLKETQKALYALWLEYDRVAGHREADRKRMRKVAERMQGKYTAIVAAGGDTRVINAAWYYRLLQQRVRAMEALKT